MEGFSVTVFRKSEFYSSFHDFELFSRAQCGREMWARCMAQGLMVPTTGETELRAGGSVVPTMSLMESSPAERSRALRHRRILLWLLNHPTASGSNNTHLSTTWPVKYLESHGQVGWLVGGIFGHGIQKKCVLLQFSRF